MCGACAPPPHRPRYGPPAAPRPHFQNGPSPLQLNPHSVPFASMLTIAHRQPVARGGSKDGQELQCRWERLFFYMFYYRHPLICGYVVVFCGSGAGWGGKPISLGTQSITGVGWGVLGWDTIRGWDGSPMSPVTHTIRKVGRGWVGDRLVPCIYSPYVFRDMFLETCPS